MNKEVLTRNRLSEWRQIEDLRKSKQQTESKTKLGTWKNDGD